MIFERERERKLNKPGRQKLMLQVVDEACKAIF